MLIARLARLLGGSRGRVVVVVAAVVGVAGCPGKSQSGHAANAPRGPRIRLGVREERSPARLVLEVDPRRKPVGPATLHTFHFTIEERVSAPEGGRAQVSVRFIEVVGTSGEPQLSDQMALAMDDLKISFSRGPRDDVQNLRIDGLRAPLDEPTVHAIVFTLFGAGRGPQLPDRPIGALDDWTIEADTEIVGLTAHQRYFYTLVAEQGPVLQIREKGHVEGIATINGARRKIDGDTFSDESLDLERGLVVGGEYEWNAAIDEEPAPAQETPGVGHIRVRVERGRLVADRKKRG
jgi:hypothetical protein